MESSLSMHRISSLWAITSGFIKQGNKVLYKFKYLVEDEQDVPVTAGMYCKHQRRALLIAQIMHAVLWRGHWIF